MKELLSQIYDGYRQFVGTGSVVVLFLSAVCVIIFSYRRTDRKCMPLLLSVCGSIAVAAAYVYELIGSGSSDRRIRSAGRIFALLLGILCISMSGTMIFSKGLFVRAENDLHLPGFVTEAADAVIADGGDGCILTMPGWRPYFESYSSKLSVVSPGDEDSDLADEDMRTLYAQLIKVHPDMKKVAASAHRKGCGYIVLSDGIWQDIPLTRFGYELIYETEGCRVYREVRTP